MKRQDELNEAWCKYMGKCSTEIMQALAFALRWTDAHPRWISVEDELPPLNQDVLVCSVINQDNAVAIDRIIQNIEDNGYVDWELYTDITHWMPLPQAPHHIIDANKKVDRVIGTADHIKTALDVLNKKGGEE